MLKKIPAEVIITSAGFMKIIEPLFSIYSGYFLSDAGVSFVFLV